MTDAPNAVVVHRASLLHWHRMEPKQFSALDGMRGIAALFVVTAHTTEYWGGKYFPHMWVTLDMFFMLSGFVIAHAYGSRLESGRLTGKGFVLVRWLRLFPVLFLSATLSLVVALLGRMDESGSVAETLGAYAAILLFLPFQLGAGLLFVPLNYPLWSLLQEMYVNVVYGLCYRFMTTRVLMGIVFVSGSVLAAAIVFHGSIDLGAHWWVRSVVGGTARAVFGIFLGILMYRVYLQRNPKRFANLSPWLPLVCALAFGCIPKGEFDWAIDLVGVFVVVPACVYIGACITRCGQRTAAFFTVMAGASYPLYLLHLPVARLLEGVIADPLSDRAPLAGVLLTLIMVVLSIAVQRYFDEPVRRYLSVKLGLRRRPAPPEVLAGKDAVGAAPATR